MEPPQTSVINSDNDPASPINDAITIGTSVVTTALSTINSIAQRILNFFLSGVVESIETILPEYGEAQNSDQIAAANTKLMERIRMILQDPKLQTEMRALAQELGRFLEIPLEELNIILKKEGDELIKNLTELIDKAIVKVGITAKDATISVIGLIPGLDALFGILMFYSAAISFAASTTGGLLKIVAPVFTQSLASMAKAIKQGESLYNRVGDFTGALSQTIERATEGASSRATAAVKTATEKLASSVPAVATAPVTAPAVAPTPTPAPAPSQQTGGTASQSSRLVLNTRPRSQPSRKRQKKYQPNRKTTKHRKQKN